MRPFADPACVRRKALRRETSMQVAREQQSRGGRGRAGDRPHRGESHHGVGWPRGRTRPSVRGAGEPSGGSALPRDRGRADARPFGGNGTGTRGRTCPSAGAHRPSCCRPAGGSSANPAPASGRAQRPGLGRGRASGRAGLWRIAFNGARSVRNRCLVCWGSRSRRATQGSWATDTASRRHLRQRASGHRRRESRRGRGGTRSRGWGSRGANFDRRSRGSRSSRPAWGGERPRDAGLPGPRVPGTST